MNQNLLEEIYRKYAQEVYLYLYSLCRNTAIAEDLMQEVFTKALLTLSDQHPNFKAWLYRVAHNICINTLRKNSRICENPDDGTNSQRRQTQAEQSGDILDKILRHEKIKLLYESMNKLPTPQKEVLYMMYFAQLKTAEIAKTLNLTPENVRVIAHRGRKTLGKILEKEGYHEL